MLKVECESCHAPYQVDERRIPKAGLKMRCPQCGYSFLVPHPGAEPTPSVPPNVPSPDFDDLLGVQGMGAPAAPAGLAFASAIDDLEFDLPARVGDASARKPTAPKLEAASAELPSIPGFGALDADLPMAASRDNVDMPAVKKAPPKIVPVVRRVAPAPAPAAPAPAPAAMSEFGDLDIELPSPFQQAPALPSPRVGMAPPSPEADLPAVGARPAAPAFGGRPAAPAAPAPPMPGGADLPSYGGGAGLPAVGGRPAAPAFTPTLPRGSGADLPSYGGGAGLPAYGGGGAAPPVGDGAGLPAYGGGAGLPAYGDGAGLPAYGGGAGLPAYGGGAGLPAYGGGAGLPAYGVGGAGLPAVGGGGAGLPAVGGGGAGLPAVGGGAGLPAGLDFGDLNLPGLLNDLPGFGGGVGLPSGQGTDLPDNQGNYPAVMGEHNYLPAQGNLPAIAQGNYLPAMPPQGSLLPGQSNLPSYDGAGGLPSTSGRPAGFGGMDTFDAGQFEAGPSSVAQSGQAGGVTFGEVDLGAGANSANVGLGSSPPGPPSRQGAAGLPGVTPERRGARAARAPAREPSKTPRVIGGVILAVVLGGVALQATPYGAFGYHAISDAFHGSEWKKTTATATASARTSLAKDVYGDARQAVTLLVDLQAKNPRARQLATYAAFTEYAVELRFGVVPEHAAKATYLLGLVPAKSDVQYLSAAQGAAQAVAGNFTEARALLATASRKDPSDPIQGEIKYVRGELELAAKDPDAAIAAFTEAGTEPTPRAHYGLARAYLMKNDRAKAKQELDATVAASPEHVGALLARVRLVWNTKQDEVSSLQDLKVVIDGAARANASPTELSRAYALRGWVYLASNRTTDARAAFDDASKLDARNVSALIGQGELLYADGRFTDALARFDDALQRTPDDIEAICGSAKTKIKLERLQEAKTQLMTARSTFKSDMSVAFWLGKAEEALGNKSVAESEYNVAIELADPALQNSVEPYAALASLLASQGRSAEALKKLEAAKVKLADSPALHRAFGDVVASQGKFDEAVIHYQKALATKEDSAVRFRLAQTYRKMRKLDLATAEFAKVSAADKDYPGLALERGMLYEEAGEEQKALEQFQGALAKAPKDLDLMLRVGAAYIAIGQADEAQRILSKVYEQRPNSAEANHFLGRAYLRQGGLQVTAAMPRLRRAAELDPNRAEYHLYVAWAANDALQPDIGLAEKEVDRALALDSTLADAYWQRGVVKYKQGAVKDAERDLRKALELKPNRIEAHAALAEVFETNNNDAGALASWAIATNAMPKQAYWRYRYGKLLRTKGKGAEAAVNLSFAVREALAHQPRPGWLYAAAFAAAETQRATGKKAEAVENYKLYLQNAPTGDPDRDAALTALKQLGGTLPD